MNSSIDLSTTQIRLIKWSKTRILDDFNLLVKKKQCIMLLLQASGCYQITVYFGSWIWCLHCCSRFESGQFHSTAILIREGELYVSAQFQITGSKNIRTLLEKIWKIFYSLRIRNRRKAQRALLFSLFQKLKYCIWNFPTLWILYMYMYTLINNLKDECIAFIIFRIYTENWCKWYI